MARYLYSLLFYLSLPGVFLRLWWKGQKSVGYRLRWRERLAFIPRIPQGKTLWLHAVSFGEMNVARPLILALRQQYPEKTLVITTMTVTGSQLAGKYVDDKTYHFYVPYDLPDVVQRFLDRVHPELAIMMETELWPNILHYTAKRGIPTLVANARLSQSSMREYRYILSLTRGMLPNIACIAAQTQQDADRFIELGAPPEHIKVMGNIKFDVPVPEELVALGRQLRASWGEIRPTVIAASTHAGEEEKILLAFAALRRSYPDALLILVPRHPERFAEVALLCEQQGFSVVRRSQNRPCTLQTQVFVGDSLGEMFLYYALCDVAFVGGSFVSVGGHNLLEPAALGIPAITGPSTFNFTEIYSLLRQAGGVVSVVDESELAKVWAELISDASRRQQMGLNAKAMVEQNRGALARHLAYIASRLETGQPIDYKISSHLTSSKNTNRVV